jgi:Glycosyl hydrolase catalytic core
MRRRRRQLPDPRQGQGLIRRVLTASAFVLAVAIAGCGGGGGEGQSQAQSSPAPTNATTSPPPTATSPPAKKAAPPAPDLSGGLAMGLSETNPNLFWHDHDVGAFASWRDRVEALKPPLYRLTVDWASLQPTENGPIDWSKPADGCMRGIPPCHPFAGITDTLRAIRSQQEAGNGFQTMVIVFGVPTWAARGPGGCERDGTIARSRPITAEGVRAYGRFVEALQALARREGVRITWWSPWNEPNQPFFISPQRAECRGTSPSLAPAIYAKFARSMRNRLQQGQQLVVGELAGLENPRKYGSSIKEFYDGLPTDVLCNADVFAQHAYAQRGDERTDSGAVGELEEVLDRHPCARKTPIWVTETGVGGPHVGDTRSSNSASVRADCQALAATLRRWNRDPRVDAAFQYTFRDDPAFPVGLADASLKQTWPTYDLFQVWAGSRKPDDPSPRTPAGCRTSG